MELSKRENRKNNSGDSSRMLNPRHPKTEASDCLPGGSSNWRLNPGFSAELFCDLGYISLCVKQGGTRFPRPSAAHPVLGDVGIRSWSHNSLFHISFLGRKSCQDLSMQVWEKSARGPDKCCSGKRASILVEVANWLGWKEALPLPSTPWVIGFTSLNLGCKMRIIVFFYRIVLRHE